MKYRKLGTTGMDVSPICLGCMSYGVPEPGQPSVDARRGGEPRRSFSERSRRASTSSTRRTSTPTARARRSSAVRSPTSPAATRSCSRRRSTARCATGPNGRGLSRKAIMHGDRRQPAPARHRLRRPLSDPPLGLPHADRGDDGGTARRRQGGEGPLHRCVVDVGVAVRKGAAHRRAPRVDAVRVDAEPLQPRSTARRSARCCRSASTRASASSPGARSRAGG